MSTKKTVSAILAVADQQIRNRLAEDFISSRYPLYTSMAHSLVSGIARQQMRNDVGDVVQMIAVEEYRMLSEDVTDTDALDAIHDWDNVLWARGKMIVSRYRTSSALHGIAGITGRTRRYLELARTAADMPEASADEIVDETNRRLSQRLSDIDRQGMRCTVEDLHAVRQEYHDDACLFEEPAVAGTSLLEETDAVRLVADIIARCQAISAEHGAVARCWIGNAMPDGDISSPAEIVAETGLDAYQVSKLLGEVRQEAIISASLVASISVYEVLGLKSAAPVS